MLAVAVGALAATAADEPAAAPDELVTEPIGDGFVALTVGVHREAGTVYDVAADGAAGQCSVTGFTITCPARAPVTFRWGPDSPFALVGDAVLAPGQQGTAIVWATEASRADVRAALAADRTNPAVVRRTFVRTSDNPIPPASAGLFADLLDLVHADDPRVRREVVDGLVPYWRHTDSDPFPLGAPSVVPPDTLSALASDPDLGVRRRLASRLREVRAPGEPLAQEATLQLIRLAGEGGGVQRAAFASLASRARDGRAPAIESWMTAIDRVATPGPPGRAAANTLAALATELEPGPDVDPVEAVRLCAANHLERTWAVWRAWRDHVPFDAVLAERLLRETLGLSPPVVRAWAEDDPDGFAAVLRRWEPSDHHSDRYDAIGRALRSKAAASSGPLAPSLAELFPADRVSPEPATGAPE